MTVSFLIHRDFQRSITHLGLKKKLGSIIGGVSNWVDSNFVDYGKNIKRIDGSRKIYKVRAGDSFRVFFQVDHQASSSKTAIYFLAIMNHDQSDKTHSCPNSIKTSNHQDHIEINLLAEVEPNESAQLLKSTYSNLFYQFTETDFARLDQADYQLWWNLNDDQQAICEQKGPVILCGSAGSGKTTIALYRLMLWKNLDFSNRRADVKQVKSLYVTYSDKLRKYAEKNYHSLRRSEIDVDFMTIQELCICSSGLKDSFSKERYVDFKKFDEFISTRNRSNFSSDTNPLNKPNP